MTAPQRQKRLHEEITAKLRDLLQSQDFAPGERLPPERRLATMFKVSRNSVREAIKSLEHQGILVSRPGAGTFITQNCRTHFAAVLGEVFARERGRLEDIFELRMLLEPEIAHLAALRVDGPTLDLLCDLVASHEQALASDQPAREIDQRFHDTIASATANHAIIRLMEQVRDLVRDSRDEGLQSPERKFMSLNGHKKILDALLRREPDSAREAMAEHLRITRGLVFTPNSEKSI